MGLSVGGNEIRNESRGRRGAEGEKEKCYLVHQRPAQGAGDGIHGDPNVSTPNMDWLARTGCDFEMAYSGMPLCSPFRGSMLTSRYPHHCVPGHEYPLDPKLPTVASVFRNMVTRLFIWGKWHLDGFHESERGGIPSNPGKSGEAV